MHPKSLHNGLPTYCYSAHIFFYFFLPYSINVLYALKHNGMQQWIVLFVCYIHTFVLKLDYVFYCNGKIAMDVYYEQQLCWKCQHATVSTHENNRPFSCTYVFVVFTGQNSQEIG